MSSRAVPYGLFETLRTEISDVLDPAYQREKAFRNFLNSLHHSDVRVTDFGSVVSPMFHSGGAYDRYDIVKDDPAKLFAALSDSEKLQLKQHYLATLKTIAQEFPNFKLGFPRQFR
jgi:hypothetical protein